MTTSPQAVYTARFPENEASVRLESTIGSGGEGSVHLALIENAPGIGGTSAWAAKLLSRETSAESYAKLEYLLASPVSIRAPNRAVQPRAMLYDADGQRSGYLMDYLPPAVWHPLTVHYNAEAARLNRQPPPGTDTLPLRYRIAANMAQTLDDLHRAGQAAGDLSETNVLADGQGRVALLDCDGWQVNSPDGRNWNIAKARPEYTPPEILHRLGQPCAGAGCAAATGHSTRQSCIARTPEHDAFPLAILIFKLLMNGEEPFGQANANPHLPRQQDTTVEHIKAGNFRYGSGHYQCCGPRDSAARERWEQLPQEIRRQLEQSLAAAPAQPPAPEPDSPDPWAAI